MAPGLSRHWHLTANLVVPVVASIVLAAIVIAGFIAWSTTDIDRRILDRQQALARQVIAEALAKVPHEQESVAIWDDAVVHASLAFDREWVETNLGVWLFEYFGHDQVAIVGAGDATVYAMSEGATLPGALPPKVFQPLLPAIHKLRHSLAGGAVGAYQESLTQRYPNVTDVYVLDGVPAVVGMMPISSDSGGIPQSAGSELIHISIARLDAQVAAEVAENYLLDRAGFSVQAPSDPALVSYPLLNAAGDIVAHFTWEPIRPGRTMLTQTLPVVAAAFLLGGIAIFFLLDRLRKFSDALMAKRAEAEHQATHDPLTGLPNRQLFDRDLSRALPERYGRDYGLAVMLLGLDRFKHVNDTLGHHAGDEVLRGVAQRLREVLGDGAHLARIAGDEFAVLHRTEAGLSSTLELAQRIIDAIGRPFNVYGNDAFVGVSIGLAIAKDDTESDPLELMRKADIALDEAKSTGRGKAVAFEESMNDHLQDRRVIESALREALRRGDQLSLSFQPLFSSRTGLVVGAEALARWHHPTLGQVSPAHFIAVAEATGLIEALGDFVLERACRLGARWPGKTIAVNISPTQLSSPGFAGRVFEILDRIGMSPHDLELEITENTLLGDDQPTVEALKRLRAAGVQIALDDFGTGYSSLNYIKRYPVDRIKIDRSFIVPLASDSVTRAVVQAMITLAHALNVDVTAEGVESREQMEILAAMKCNVFQGYLFSPAVSEQAVERMFRTGKSSDAARVA